MKIKQFDKIIKNQLKKIPGSYEVDAFFRAKAQERKIRAELAYYRAKATRKDIILPEREELGKLLQERLRRRNIVLRPKKKGELNIFLAYQLFQWERILQENLKKFGRVTEFELQSRGFDIQAPRADWLAQRDRMNIAMLDAFYEANNKQHIDIVFGYLTSYMVDPLIIKKMGDAGAIIFNFSFDDKLSFRGEIVGNRWTGTLPLASMVDLNLTNAPDSCIKYMAEGGLSMFWPEAADPDVHRPYNIPFEYDVSLVCQRYGWRRFFVNNLRKKGINIEVYGRHWENGPLSNEEMIKMYSRSRINLGFGSVGYSKKVMCLKGRDFEIPMSGGLYLTQDNPELSLVYDLGREILTYKNERDCVAKIRYLLKDPEGASKIREAGRQRALKCHTWEKRLEEIFKITSLF